MSRTARMARYLEFQRVLPHQQCHPLVIGYCWRFSAAHCKTAHDMGRLGMAVLAPCPALADIPQLRSASRAHGCR